MSEDDALGVCSNPVNVTSDSQVTRIYFSKFSVRF